MGVHGARKLKRARPSEPVTAVSWRARPPGPRRIRVASTHGSGDALPSSTTVRTNGSPAAIGSAWAAAAPKRADPSLVSVAG